MLDYLQSVILVLYLSNLIIDNILIDVANNKCKQFYITYYFVLLQSFLLCKYSHNKNIQEQKKVYKVFLENFWGLRYTKYFFMFLGKKVSLIYYLVACVFIYYKLVLVRGYLVFGVIVCCVYLLCVFVGLWASIKNTQKFTITTQVLHDKNTQRYVASVGNYTTKMKNIQEFETKKEMQNWVLENQMLLINETQANTQNEHGDGFVQMQVYVQDMTNISFFKLSKYYFQILHYLFLLLL